ncbi:MAG: carboxypeptidase-like regulatory domain-containing protein [Armatimonadota bacterium]|nr:carboxypeptidase-like regulatory domain-containing protein [bacterium]
MKHLRCYIGLTLAVLLILSGVCVSAADKTYEIFGTVTYPDGAPAAGIHVTADGPNCKCYKVDTDTNGCYCITVQSSRLWFSGEAGDYVISQQTAVPEDSTQPVRKDLKLEYAHLVMGEVTDASTGAPIEDAKVDICGGYGTSTKSGSNGMFRARVPHIGNLEFEISKDGYVTKRIDFSTQESDTSAWRIQLKPDGVIRGKVVDSNGQPVAGICVRITEDKCYSRSVKTDKDGRYEMRNVDPDLPARMGLEDPRITMFESKSVEFPKGSKETEADFVVDLAEKKLRQISGTVTDENGSPVAGANVIFGQSTCQWNRKDIRTDNEGKYVLNEISPGNDMILVQADGYAPEFASVGEKGDQQIDVKIGKPHSAELLVVDPVGKPLTGASVTINCRTRVLGKLYSSAITNGDVYRWLYITTTNDHGKVVLKDLPAEGIVVSAYKEGYAAQDDTAIRVDATDNVIKMQGMPQISGMVTDAAIGKPLQSFTVKWETLGSYSFGGDDNTAFNSPDGKFLIQVGDSRMLDQKKFTVRVWAKGYVGESRTITAVDAPTVDYANIFKMQKTYSQKGRIVNDSGKGVAEAQVTVLDSRGYFDFMSPQQIAPNASVQKYTTGSDGSFTIDPIIEKTGIIMVEKQGYPKLVEQNVDLTKPVKLVMNTPASLTINATSMLGEETKVELQTVKNRCYRNLPSKDLPENGCITCSELEPGDYIVVMRGARHMELRPITLKPGQKYILDLDKKRKVTLKGSVTRSGKPMPDTNVSVQRGYNEYISSSQADSQGQYEIDVEESGPAALVYYENRNGELVSRRELPINLQSGENRYDIKLPAGSISGRVTDAKTGQPLGGEIVQALTKWVPVIPRRYDRPEVNRGWGELLSSTKTADDGSFMLESIQAGSVVLSVAAENQYTKYLGNAFTVSEKTPVKGVEIKMPETGVLDLSVIDSKTGRPVLPCNAILTTKDGVHIFSNCFAIPTSVPAGKYILWVEPYDQLHIPACSNVEIKPDKTAKVTFKLNASPQRIVFKAAKGGRLEKLRWPDKDPKTSNKEENVLLLREDVFKERPWIGYTISDARTGKAVLIGSSGPEWGGYIQGFDNKRQAYLSIKPGVYILDAVLRNTEDYSVNSKANLWTFHRKITVAPGKNTVIEVK